MFVETTSGKGTTFRLQLPLTMATFKGILVEEASRLFVFPTVYTQRVLRVKRTEIETLASRPTIRTGDRTVPLVRLADVLQIPRSPDDDAVRPEDRSYLQALVVESGERRIAVQVDRVVREDEVLFKEMGKQLSRVANVSGVTVLGSGDVVPILSIPDFIDGALRGEPAPATAIQAAEHARDTTKSLLVVEDSITSRNLLRNVLESAGYRVQVAVDGLEGWAAVNEGTFDAVITDVEMPRMDGFTLAEKIRQGDRLPDISIILVTSRESPEDRERGIDVGANAYVAKSNFDQRSLLDTLRNLV